MTWLLLSAAKCSCTKLKRHELEYHAEILENGARSLAERVEGPIEGQTVVV